MKEEKADQNGFENHSDDEDARSRTMQLNTSTKKSKKRKESGTELESSDNNRSVRANFVFATPKNTPKQAKQKRSAEEEKVPKTEPIEEPSPKKSKKRNDTSSSEVDEVETPRKKSRPQPHPNDPMHLLTPIKNRSLSPAETPSKKKKKKKSREGEQSSQSQQSETETEATSSAPAKAKKSKKEKLNGAESLSQSDRSRPQFKKPPTSLLKYYAEHVYQGKSSRMEKSFEKLTKKERKKLNAEYNEKVESYVSQLKQYLNTLPKEEAIEYASLF